MTPLAAKPVGHPRWASRQTPFRHFDEFNDGFGILGWSGRHLDATRHGGRTVAVPGLSRAAATVAPTPSTDTRFCSDDLDEVRAEVQRHGGEHSRIVCGLGRLGFMACAQAPIGAKEAPLASAQHHGAVSDRRRGSTGRESPRLLS
jgi:hypothetical protein